MEKSIYRYILSHTKRDQIALILLTLASMPTVYYSLEVPKLIINNALGGNNVPAQIFGFDATQIGYLWFLSCVFLLLVIVNGGLKYIINVYRGVLGERMLRRFRYMLFNRVLRFPIAHFKNVSSSEIIPMITAETRPLGGFIGDSIALPVFQGGLLITYLFFIFKQDLWLGLAAIALYPPQMWIIPKLQQRVNLLAKRRTLQARKLADHIGESVAGISDIHSHHTSVYERAKISKRLGTMYGIRFEIYKRKFFIKFLNNFLAVLTPFFFYAIGGYQVLQGNMSLGALVAVLAAYKDVSPPWKELLKFYQITQDIKVKYAQIIEQFDPPKMFDPKLLDEEPQEIKPLLGKITTNNLAYAEDEEARSIDAVSAELDIPKHTAIIGATSRDSDDFTRLLTRLIVPVAGEIQIDQQNTRTIPEAVLGRKMAYCDADSYVFNGTIADNLYYGLKHQAIAEWDGSLIEPPGRATFIKEALAAGNSTQDSATNWIDFQATGSLNREQFQSMLINVLGIVELDEELFKLGLNQVAKLDAHTGLNEKLLQLRTIVAQKVNTTKNAELVDGFHPDIYSNNLSVANNILFGSSLSDEFNPEMLPANTLINQLLTDQGLNEKFLTIGLKLAELMLDIFTDVDDDSELFEQFSFIKSDDFNDYERILKQVKNHGIDGLLNTDREWLKTLTYQLTPAQHRLGLINDEIKPLILSVRKALRKKLGDNNKKVIFFDVDKINPSLSIQDNIIFGRIVNNIARAETTICQIIIDAVNQLQLREQVVIFGLDYIVGNAGRRLTSTQRQQIIVARCLIKNPDILVINQALSALSPQQQKEILFKIIEYRKGKNIIWTLNDPDLQSHFDSTLTIHDGKLISHVDTKIAA